jgi:Uma2 family endonuclease
VEPVSTLSGEISSMATASQSVPLLITAEEFGNRSDPGYLEELVRGRIETTTPPRARHGQVCNKVGRILGNHADENDLGHVLSNDSGVITERGPDTVRGADIAYYSYQKVSRGPLPERYLDVPPDLIIEVLSPNDRWPKVLTKVAEYLNIGVTTVGVLDPERSKLTLFENDQPVRVLSEDDELYLPALLGKFRVPVRKLLD